MIDDQVGQLAALNFLRRASTQVSGMHEQVAHENYIGYFEQDESSCSITVRAVVHVARQFP